MATKGQNDKGEPAQFADGIFDVSAAILTREPEPRGYSSCNSSVSRTAGDDKPRFSYP
jgi:hypothetical protein